MLYRVWKKIVASAGLSGSGMIAGLIVLIFGLPGSANADTFRRLYVHNTTAALGLSEFRVGAAHHDSGIFGTNKEDEWADVTAELRFVSPRYFEWAFSPRPHIGVNVNTHGDTSSAYFGLTWDWLIAERILFSFDFGGAVHNGELSTNRLDRKELGSRILFREAINVGLLFGPNRRHSLSLRLDHISNASLADNNDGLDTVAIIYGIGF